MLHVFFSFFFLEFDEEATYVWKLGVGLPVGEEPVGDQIVFETPADDS